VTRVDPRAVLSREVGTRAAAPLEPPCAAQSYVEQRGGNRSCGDTQRPRSCGDTRRPRSCAKPGIGNRSHGDTRRPQSYPASGGGVLPPKLARATLLLVISGDFFLVASYCPTKHSRVLKKSSAFSPPPLLLRSHHRHGFFFDFFRPCPSVVMSSALQRHQLS
jgi:hypothetical protein